MFTIRVIAKQGSKFDALLLKGKEDIGAIGKDELGIYINLARHLTVQETIELMKCVNGLNMLYYQESVEIRYLKTNTKE